MSVDQAAAALRPAQGDDAEALRAFVASLSREAIESRTHSAGVRLDPRALLCGETGRAYVATIDDVIAGVACYAPVDADGTAEFAIVITDRHQGRGLGSMLSSAVVADARDHGVQRLLAITQPDNGAMRRVLTKLQLPARQRFTGDGLELTVDLVNPPAAGS
jgi:RimJ/RimL family protein N-acetyltransferase